MSSLCNMSRDLLKSTHCFLFLHMAVHACSGTVSIYRSWLYWSNYVLSYFGLNTRSMGLYGAIRSKHGLGLWDMDLI